MNKKFLFVGHRFGKVGRAGYHLTKRLAQAFPNVSDYLIENDIENWNTFLKLSSNYNRVIFVTQNLISYKIGLDFVKLMNLDHLVFIRNEYNFSSYNSCSNGFHYYLKYDMFKFFFPCVLDFNLKIINLPKTEYPTIGFYYRPDVAPDSCIYFLNLIKYLSEEINVVLLGYKNDIIATFNNVKFYQHTIDNNYFFNAIDYFIYPMSKIFEDPFPNTLLEAIQCNKQIVIPELSGRTHKDGIDDIIDCSNFSRDLKFTTQIDNSKTIFRFDTFSNFYQRVLDNNFEYSFERNNFDNFYNWIEKEVLT